MITEDMGKQVYVDHPISWRLMMVRCSALSFRYNSGPNFRVGLAFFVERHVAIFDVACLAVGENTGHVRRKA